MRTSSGLLAVLGGFGALGLSWPRYLSQTGMRNGRGKGGKRAHKPTGIAAQRRAARKARNRARA